MVVGIPSKFDLLSRWPSKQNVWVTWGSGPPPIMLNTDQEYTSVELSTKMQVTVTLETDPFLTPSIIMYTSSREEPEITSRYDQIQASVKAYL